MRGTSSVARWSPHRSARIRRPPVELVESERGTRSGRTRARGSPLLEQVARSRPPGRRSLRLDSRVASNPASIRSPSGAERDRGRDLRPPREPDRLCGGPGRCGSPRWSSTPISRSPLRSSICKGIDAGVVLDAPVSRDASILIGTSVERHLAARSRGAEDGIGGCGERPDRPRARSRTATRDETCGPSRHPITGVGDRRVPDVADPDR